MPKTLIIDLDRDTSPYNPNRPNYFSMQTENKPSKWTQELSKKHKVWSPKVFRQVAKYSSRKSTHKQELYKDKDKQTLT